MNILIVGDASNFNVTLADAMRQLGHNVLLMSEGSKWMNTARDIDISRQPGTIGAAKYLFRLFSLLTKMKGWDAVYIHTPTFLQLRPEKVGYFFDYLQRNNRYVVYSMIGTDSNYVKACLDCHTFRYSDYRVGDELSPYAVENPSKEREWTTNEMQKLNDSVTEHSDLIIPCLWEYYHTYETIAPSKLHYGGIPIATKNIEKHLIEEEPERVRFFLGYHNDRMALKGTDRILEALRKVVSRHPDKAEMEIVTNVPYNEYVGKLNRSHVILDQLYSYTPATNALLGMARGMVAVSGAEPEYYDFIGETENRPIVNISPLDPQDIENKLEWIIANKRMLPELSRQSAAFVVKHNDSIMIAKKHLSLLHVLCDSRLK